ELGGFVLVDEFELRKRASAFEVGDLAADHALGVDRLSNNLDRLHVGCAREPGKCFGQQCVAGENPDCFAVNDMGRLAAASQIVVVECRKIVVHERVRVDQLERGE